MMQTGEVRLACQVFDYDQFLLLSSWMTEAEILRQEQLGLSRQSTLR